MKRIDKSLKMTYNISTVKKTNSRKAGGIKMFRIVTETGRVIKECETERQANNF